MQWNPSPWLSGIVKHYLVVEAERAPSLNYRLFSDGNPGIVFHFDDPLKFQPRSFLYGQITRYNDWLSDGKLGMLVVVLQPTGLSSLVRIPAHELNDNLIRLSDLFGQEAIDLEEQVISACRPGPLAEDLFHRTFHPAHPAIRCIEQFLFRRMVGSLKPDPFIPEALQLMTDSRGLVRMDELLRKIPVTERQLERKFKTAIGISPKKMADIIKFQYFLKLLQQHPADGNLSDAVYEGGYYDQAHLNNYFKKIVGLTPRQYKVNPYLLAVNFMQVPG
jgi:AraC-like DNA-binding protein